MESKTSPFDALYGHVEASPQPVHIHAELIKLTEFFLISRDEIATILDVSKDTVNGYMCGRIKRIPESALIKLNRHINSFDPEIKKRRLFLSQNSMGAIVDVWFNELGVNSVIKLACVIGVSIETVRRWQNGGPCKSKEHLLKYDRLVMNQKILNHALAPIERVNVL